MSTDASDGELLRRARFHDQDAWHALYVRHLPMAWRFAVRQVDDAHDAEDLVAEAMVALLRSLDGPAEIECVGSWLRAVIRHKTADLFRGNGRRRRVLQQRVEATAAGELAVGGAAEPLQSLEDQSMVAGILSDMPDRQQIVLELKYYQELSVREIALRLEETEKAVEALLYRARREFRRRYDAAQRRPRASLIATREEIRAGFTSATVSPPNG